MALALGHTSDSRITEHVLFIQSIPHSKTFCASICVYVFVWMEMERKTVRKNEREAIGG